MRRIFWLVLLLSLTSMLPPAAARIRNENNNKAVILAWDYASFLSIADKNGGQDPDMLSRLAASGLSAAIINAQPLYGEKYGALFDDTLATTLKNTGFALIPRLGILPADGSFYDRLENAISIYDIRYILFQDRLTAMEPSTALKLRDEQFDRLADMVKKYKLTIFLTENPEQTGYLGQPALDSLIRASDYSIKRAFFINPESSEIRNESEAAAMWLRAVADRNIRLVCVSPLKNLQNTAGTLAATERLAAQLRSRGFVPGGNIAVLDAAAPGKLYGVPVVLSLLAASGLGLLRLKAGRNLMAGVLAALSVPAVTALLFWNSEGSVWAAFAAASIFPSLYAVILADYAASPERHKSPALPEQKTAWLGRLVPVLCLLLALTLAGALTVTASMFDIRYIMQLINYNAAIPSYILPPAVFIITFITKAKSAPAFYVNNAWNKPLKGWRHTAAITLSAVFFSAAFLYSLARSGNFNIVPPLPFELELRSFLEQITSARPRFKEFLAGYPALFLFVYFFNRPVNKMLHAVLGALSVMAPVSIINSFCHGFTPVYTSLSRSLNGLVLGTATGFMAIGCAGLLHYGRKRFKWNLY